MIRAVIVCGWLALGGCASAEPVIMLAVVDQQGLPIASAMITLITPSGKVHSLAVNDAGAWHSHWSDGLHPLELGNHTVIIRTPEGYSESRQVTGRDFRRRNPVALTFRLPM